MPGWTRIAAVPGVAGLVVLAFWIGGGKLTNDFALSLLLTTVFVGAVGAATLAAALRWRQLALPLLATFVVSSGSIGGYLAYVTFDDTVVDERVVVAPPAGEAAPGDPTELAAGTFARLAHETTGRVALVELPTARSSSPRPASRPTRTPTSAST